VSLSDEELVDIVHRQSAPMQSAEMAQLIYRYTRTIRIKAAKLRNTGIESEDLLQEGFLGLLDAIRSYHCDRGPFTVFADVCISNRMKTAASKAGKNRLTPAEDYDFEQISDKHDGAEDYVILKERNFELYSKLEKLLTQKEFEVLRFYLAGFSYKEIAARLGISKKSVDNSLSRAKQKLKNKL